MTSKSSITILQIIIVFLISKGTVNGDYPQRDGCPMKMTEDCMDEIAKEMKCGDLGRPVLDKVSDMCCVNLYYNYLEDCYFNSLVQDVVRHKKHCQRDPIHVHSRADQIWDFCTKFA